MSKALRPSSVVQAELTKAQEQAETLRVNIAVYKDELKKMESRLGDLVGVWGRYSEIKRLQDELERSRIAEHDAVAPKIRVTGRRGGLHVFVKRTAKRIYTRPVGGSREEFWNHDGSSTSSFSSDKLNLEDLAIAEGQS